VKADLVLAGVMAWFAVSYTSSYISGLCNDSKVGGENSILLRVLSSMENDVVF
jgi:hypothetical protein